MRSYPKELFKDLLIIELSSVLAGPLVGSFFSELGAKIIKIENAQTNGDVTRRWKLNNEPENELSAYYQCANYNKETLLLDLQQKNDQQQLHQLIKKADIVISNYTLATRTKLNLEGERIQKINPKVIFVQLSAYSKDDQRSGFDVAMQAETGFMFMTGYPDRHPVKIPVAIIDILAAHQMKEAALIGLLKMARTGEGSIIDISLYQSGISALVNQATNYLIANKIPTRIGAEHPNIAPYGDVFTTSDEKMLVLAVGSDAQFKQLIMLLELSEYHDSYRSNQERINQREALNGLLQKKILTKNAQWIKHHFILSKIPFGFIKSMDDVMDEPLAQEMLLKNDLDNQIISNIAFSFR